MSRPEKWIGFDRRLELSWLDMAASKVAAGVPADELQKNLIHFLQSLSYDPTETGSARPKTVRVILRIWGSPDVRLKRFNASCAKLFRSAEAGDRLALHWAMTLAAYPYFYTHAHVIGRLLALHDNVSAMQIRRRITEKWGDRSTVERTSRHVVRTMVAWRTLIESGKGQYSGPAARYDVTTPVAAKLAWAVLFNLPGRAAPLEQLVKHPALFPFDFRLGISDVERDREMEVAQEGVGTVMVGMTNGR